ncbi:hypothetical protein FRC02_002078 [Tulasnella sp. 418]|nr:hypothetical protein FRC02_002078 [Tulasnella sp. 418]
MSSPPRSILKRSPSASSSSSNKTSRSPSVSFSNNISTTYLTHAPTTYNRSPIEVSFNECSLPRRGCPGRTYSVDQHDSWLVALDDSEDDDASSSDDSEPPMTPPPTSPSNDPLSRGRPIPTRNHIDNATPTTQFAPGYSIPRPKVRLPASTDSSEQTIDSWACLNGF